MSQFLKTRDPIQCRSHHMKQLKASKSIKNIIKKVKRRVGETEYKALFEQNIAANPDTMKATDMVREPKKKPQKPI